MSVGSIGQVRDFEELVGASDALLVETRRLLEEARLYLRGDPRRGPDGAPDLDAAPGGPEMPGPDGSASSPRSQRRMPLLWVGTLMASVGVVLFGVAVLELSQGPAQQALQVGASAPLQAHAPATVASGSHPNPVPSPPPPLWVSIPRLNARAPVEGEVQVFPDGPEKGLLSAPPNYHDLGWFRQFGGGILVLDGHVGYRNDPGPLAFIGSLRSGDEVIVGNQSSQLAYEVTVVATAVKGQLPPEYFTAPYSRDVMLITCDYASPFSNGHFADNVYVIAEPVK